MCPFLYPLYTLVLFSATEDDNQKDQLAQTGFQFGFDMSLQVSSITEELFSALWLLDVVLKEF